MPLAAHNGKLLYGTGATWASKLRCFCCCTWALAAVAYTDNGGDGCYYARVVLPPTDWPPCYSGTLSEVAQSICESSAYVNMTGCVNCYYPPSHSGGVRVFPTIQSVTETGNTGHATATVELGVCHSGETPMVYTFEFDFVKRTHPT